MVSCMSKRIRTSVACFHDDKVLLCEMTDPKSKKIYFFPPGGKIEKDETFAEAAVRETLEETGYEVKIHEKSLHTIQYLFHWNGKTRDCTTHFFTATLLSDVQRKFSYEEYQTGVIWLPIKDIKKTFSYHDEIRDAMIHLAKKAR